MITDTTMKDASAAVTQVANGYTADITISVNPMACTMQRRLRPAEVLERANPLLVPHMPDR